MLQGHAQIGRFLISELSTDAQNQTPVAHFVDVGTGSGERSSVTRYLEDTLPNFRGLCIEPRADAHSALRSNRPLCRAPRVALGEKDQELFKAEFALDGENSFLGPSGAWTCSAATRSKTVPTHEIHTTQLSTLLAKESSYLCATGDPYNDLLQGDRLVGREEWIGYLHIEVYGEGMPILLGAVAPLEAGPPLSHQREAYMLPQFVGLNTSLLLDTDQMLTLLVDVLEYRQVQMEEIAGFILLARTAKSLDVPLSLLHRPYFELSCQTDFLEHQRHHEAAALSMCTLFIGFPYRSDTLDPPYGTKKHCMERLRAEIFASEGEEGVNRGFEASLHLLESRGTDAKETVPFSSHFSEDFLAVLSVEGSHGHSCQHLQRTFCVPVNQRQVNYAQCSGMPALQAKDCLAKAYFRSNGVIYCL